jgi:hypothetical protein
MNPERWQKVDELLSAALEHDAGQRVSFLAQAGWASAMRRSVARSAPRRYAFRPATGARGFAARPDLIPKRSNQRFYISECCLR